jgi:gluconate 2-dehydrogenase subunit 3-like protein
MTQSRRDFIARGIAGGVGLFTFTIAGCEKKVTPAQARAAGADFRTLTPAEVTTLDALGEILLPGAAAAGMSHFIDHQLSGNPADSMLMIKYLRVPAPFIDFYRAGLRGAEQAANKRFNAGLSALKPEQGGVFVQHMAMGQLEGWTGPPAALFFFVLRNDAVDTVYGTPSGFEKLGVPYMPHIAPPTAWGE